MQQNISQLGLPAHIAQRYMRGTNYNHAQFSFCVLSLVQRFVLCNELALALPFEEVFEALAHLCIPGDVLEPLASDDLELHRRRPEKHTQTGH